MKQYNPRIHHRRSIRLRTRDYSQPGTYFLTLCTQGKECLFGSIANGELRLNDSGQMIWKWWYEIPHKYPAVHLDSAIVMPNHFHGIIVIDQTNAHVGAVLRDRPMINTDRPSYDDYGQTRRSAPTVGDMVRWFKTMTTNDYMDGVNRRGWMEFPGRVWQRNYFEHIIRDETDLVRIREYINHNPVNWVDDEENPANNPPSHPNNPACRGGPA